MMGKDIYEYTSHQWAVVGVAKTVARDALET